MLNDAVKQKLRDKEITSRVSKDGSQIITGAQMRDKPRGEEAAERRW